MGSAPVIGLVGGAIMALAMLLGLTPATSTPWKACAPVTWSVSGGVDAQHGIVAAAVDQVANASGQHYLEVPDTTNPALSIVIWPARAGSRWLQVDGTADDGYTRWTPAAGAGIDLLIGYVSTPLVLHELMLSRHLVEADDPGGLLGHVVPNLQAYPAQDLAMLAAGSCV